MRDAIKKGKKKPPYDKSKAVDKILKIEEKHAERLMSDVLWIAYQTKKIKRENYLATFSGYGIAGRANLLRTPSEEAVAEIEPLADVMKHAAQRVFGAVMVDILRDTDLRDYYLSRMSALQGKKGGRPEGKRRPHITWLEEKLNLLKIRHKGKYPNFTAEDYFEELRQHPDIDGEDDDGKLRFHADVLEKLGWREGSSEPAITLNSVLKVLSRIRKSNSP